MRVCKIEHHLKRWAKRNRNMSAKCQGQRNTNPRSGEGESLRPHYVEERFNIYGGFRTKSQKIRGVDVYSKMIPCKKSKRLICHVGGIDGGERVVYRKIYI